MNRFEAIKHCENLPEEEFNRLGKILDKAMEVTYEQIVELVAKEIKQTPSMTEKQIKGYVEYLGVFVPHMRDRIISDARELNKKDGTA